MKEDIVDAELLDDNGVPIDADNGVVKEYAEVGFESMDEANLYGDQLIELIMAGLDLYPYVPAGREVNPSDYTGKERKIIDCYNAALKMRMLLDAMMARSGQQASVV